MSADSVLIQAPAAPLESTDPLSRHPGVMPVDAFEIAASLEASGVNDKVALSRYGHPDVFALAKQYFEDLVAEPDPPSALAPDPVNVGDTLLRGLVFVLPALLTGAVLGRHPELPLVWAVLAAVAVGWAAGQGIAYVGYRILGAGSATGAHWQMRTVAALTMVAAGIAGAAAVFFGLFGWLAILLALGQIAFVLASSIALVLDRPAVIGYSLVPGLAASAPALLWPGLVPRWLVLAAVCGTLALSIGWVGYLLRDAEPPAARLSRAATRGALPYIGYGICLALLLSFALVDSLVATTHLPISVTMAPLMCGVVIAEFQLAHYRRRAEAVLRTTSTRAAAARALRYAVLRCLGGYLLGLAVLTLVTVLLLARDLDTVGMLRFAGAGVLGWAFLAALLLVAYQQLKPVLLVSLVALVLLGARELVPPLLGADRATELALQYLVVCTALAAVLTVVTLRLLVKPELHR